MFKNLNPSMLGVLGHQSEQIELALTHGFLGVDINLADFATRTRLKGLPYAKRLVESAQTFLPAFRVGTFLLPIDWDVDDETFKQEMQKLPEYADAAAALDCPTCIAFISPASDKRPLQENFEFHRHRFHDIARVFGRSDVNLALGFRGAENLRANRAHQFITDLNALVQLVGMIGSSNVGLLVDPWEVYASGGTLDDIKKLNKDQIFAARIAEMDKEAVLSTIDDKGRLLPDAENGRIGLVSFIQFLKEIGFEGPVTPTPSKHVFSSRKRDIIVKQTSESTDAVWVAAGLPKPSRPTVSVSADIDFELPEKMM